MVCTQGDARGPKDSACSLAPLGYNSEERIPDYDRVQLLLMMPKFDPRSYVDIRAHRKLAAAAPDQVRQATYVITHCTYRTSRASMCLCVL